MVDPGACRDTELIASHGAAPRVWGEVGGVGMMGPAQGGAPEEGVTVFCGVFST